MTAQPNLPYGAAERGALAVKGVDAMHERGVIDKVAAVDARVVTSASVCRDHVSIELVLPSFPSSTPGQFLQLLCGDASGGPPSAMDTTPGRYGPPVSPEFGARVPFVRRPFSLADRWDDERGDAHISIIARTIGPGTRYLSRLRPGDRLNLTGPLGHGFTAPGASVPIVLIGGGVGIPPLLYMARHVHDLGHADVTAIFAATTRDLLPLSLLAEPAADATPSPCVRLPGDAPFPAIITTDDGTAGLRGRATDGLRAWHARRVAGNVTPCVLACGPEPMLRAVAALTRTLRLDCQLCIERNMACGLGTCLSCVVRRRDAGRPTGWRWALACMDGPVFSRDELLDFDPSAVA